MGIVRLGTISSAGFITCLETMHNLLLLPTSLYSLEYSLSLYSLLCITKLAWNKDLVHIIATRASGIKILVSSMSFLSHFSMLNESQRE